MVVSESDPTPKKPDPPWIEQFKAARRVSTPLLAIETPDAASTIAALFKAVTAETPILSWDCARGLRGLNTRGQTVLEKLENVDQMQTVNATEALLACEDLPDLSIVFMHNFHRQLEDVPNLQACWNLRDVFKLNKRMIVMLGPSFQFPAELAGDVIVLDEPLPNRDALSDTLDIQHANADLLKPDDETRAAALDAMVGLPSFTAEQVTAMSLRKSGIHIPQLWERKIKAVENTDGLRVWQGRPGDTSMDELRGIDNVVAFMNQLIDADAFGAVVFIDEMDKAFAGGMSDHTGDSGVSKDQVGTVLSYIEDTGSLGVLLAGVAGTGKTQLAKAMGMKSGKPVVLFDLGAMKGGLVGASERTIRQALKVVTATAEGRVLFVGTANRTTLFTPELNRRFPDQFFYDVPSDAARSAIWPVYIAKNHLTSSQATVPPGMDDGWTGAEIKRACERSALFGCTVVQAAQHIIPASVSGARIITALRREADGRLLSAAEPGFYQAPRTHDAIPSLATRSIEVQ